jgi:hypothetical protein
MNVMTEDNTGGVCGEDRSLGLFYAAPARHAWTHICVVSPPMQGKQNDFSGRSVCVGRRGDAASPRV